MENQKQGNTLIIIAISLSALVSAVVGGAAGMMASSSGMSLPFFLSQNGSEAQELSKEEVDKKIFELIEEESATISVVERVTPAVVSVVIKKPIGEIRTGEYVPYDNFFFLEPAEIEEGEDPDRLVEIGGGSGFFVTENGLVVTNRHVVEQEDVSYFIVTNDGQEYPAEVVDIDPFLDIAVMRVEGEDFPAVTLGDSDGIRIGQTVIAIGNTLSEYRNTVTKGVVSGINRHVSAGNAFGGTEILEKAIQTDAAINPGNSGGPLINLLGEVIAMNTAISAEGEGVGFSIPINEVKGIIEDIEEFGRIVRPWLGVRYVMLTEDIAKENGLSVQNGALLVEGAFGESAVVPESPAEVAGFKAGDIITGINDEALDQERSLAEAVRNFEPGDEIHVSVLRGEEELEFLVVLGEYGDE